MEANQILTATEQEREKREGCSLFNSELHTRNHFSENVFCWSRFMK